MNYFIFEYAGLLGGYIATTSEDIRPDVNHPTVSRDYEYKSDAV